MIDMYTVLSNDSIHFVFKASHQELDKSNAELAQRVAQNMDPADDDQEQGKIAWGWGRWRPLVGEVVRKVTDCTECRDLGTAHVYV